MLQNTTVFFFLLFFSTLPTCHFSTFSKINFNTASISDEGQLDGVTLAYEFCIPRDSVKLKKVRKVDANVEVFTGSPGRIGCTEVQWLCISHTQQSGFRQVLRRLARLDFVERIDRCWFE